MFGVNRNGRFLFIIFVGLSCLGQRAFAMELMTEEQKQESLEQFEQVAKDTETIKLLNSSKPQTMASASSEFGQPLDAERFAALQDNFFFKKGKFKAKITYKLDADFPTHYGSAKSFRFSDDKSVAFREQWTDIIFTHYFGDDYNKYEPELVAVTEIFSAYVLFSNREELEELLSDGRIISAWHKGTPMEPAVLARDLNF